MHKNTTPVGGASTVAAVFPAVSPVTAAVPPQPLPQELQPLFDLVAALAARTGYCFARTVWFAKRLGVSRVHAWRLLKKLEGFGRLVVESVPGSRERRLYPVFFRAPRKRAGNAGVTPVRSTCIRTKPSAKETDKQPGGEPVPDPAVVVVLEEAGVRKEAIPALARKHRPERIRQVVDAVKAMGEEARSAAALVVDALKKDYLPGRKGGGAVSSREERRREVDRPRRYVTAPREDGPQKAPECPETGGGGLGDRFAGMTPKQRLAVLAAERAGKEGAGG